MTPGKMLVWIGFTAMIAGYSSIAYRAAQAKDGWGLMYAVVQELAWLGMMAIYFGRW